MSGDLVPEVKPTIVERVAEIFLHSPTRNAFTSSNKGTEELAPEELAILMCDVDTGDLSNSLRQEMTPVRRIYGCHLAGMRGDIDLRSTEQIIPYLRELCSLVMPRSVKVHEDEKLYSPKHKGATGEDNRLIQLRANRPVIAAAKVAHQLGLCVDLRVFAGEARQRELGTEGGGRFRFGAVTEVILGTQAHSADNSQETGLITNVASLLSEKIEAMSKDPDDVNDRLGFMASDLRQHVCVFFRDGLTRDKGDELAKKFPHLYVALPNTEKDSPENVNVVEQVADIMRDTFGKPVA